MDSKKLISLVKKISSLQGVQAIYLFGSQARGEAGSLSDVDICVITSPTSDKAAIQGYASKKVDVVLFDDLPLNMRVRVFREGKALYVADEQDMHQLEWRTMKEYIDYKPFLKRFIEAYLPGAHYV